MCDPTASRSDVVWRIGFDDAFALRDAGMVFIGMRKSAPSIP